MKYYCKRREKKVESQFVCMSWERGKPHEKDTQDMCATCEHAEVEEE